jgi:acyl-CoA synthetase (AMP-forming)/AMP-acid ligase II
MPVSDQLAEPTSVAETEWPPPVPRPELPFSPSIPELISYCVRTFPDNEMVVTENVRLTYAQAEVASRQLAKRLVAAGVGKGTRIGTQFPYGVEWLITWLAIDRIGALHMPFSSALKPAELLKVLRLGDVQVFLSPDWMFGLDRTEFIGEALPELSFGPDGQLLMPELPFLRSIWFVESVERAATDGAGANAGGSGEFAWAPRVSVLDPSDGTGINDEMIAAIEREVAPADFAITIFTSGTSSEPKAVLHTQAALVTKGAHLAALQGWTSEDRIFCGMPFFWVGGIAMTVAPAIYVGATLLCVDRTEATRSLDFMEREQATVMTGWPGVRGPIEGDPTRPDRKIPAFADLPPGGSVLRRSAGIGMTETLASYTWPRRYPEAWEGKLRSTGMPVDGGEVRIADPITLKPLPEGEEGAITVRGYFVTTSLYKKLRADTFSIDGFYNTGDKGYLRDGEVFFTGRLTEMIKTSGNNVAPPEVEGVFQGFPEVAQVHVMAVAHPTRGETVEALVVAKPGTAPDPIELRERARTQLSNFKVPRHVFVIDEDELPWLASGKPDRLGIQRLLTEKVGQLGAEATA